MPWEIGLADTQQTLVLNGLRDRITVQCDGGMRTARDVIVAALLGAEEYGFATAPLVVSGCIMMRVCHLDTCPVGVATQNPELRARFNGKPEFVENFFRFIAEDVRHYLAELGFRSIDEAVGHAEMLDTDPGIAHWKSQGLDLTPVFAVPPNASQRRRTTAQDHGLEQALDRTLIQLAEGALEDAHPVRLELPVRNVNRTVGTLLGSEVTRRYGAQGLPDDTIHVTLTGSAGQSIGAFLPPGITLELIGDANDYVGKGLSGGRIIVRPPDDVLFLPEDNVIAGNTLLFGATSGEVYLRGRVGERFAARNSGALTVVEGVGDHACEYMTGGRVVVLGKTGRNMAAGMSGGIAFVLGLDPAKVNTEMVELQRLEPEDLSWLRERDRQARRLHRQHRGDLGAVRLAKAQRTIHQDHAPRLPARAGGHPDGQARGQGRRHRDHGGQPWLIQPDFSKIPKVEAAKRPVDERVGDWREVYERQDPHERAGEVSQQAGRCMDCGIPFCHSGTAGCPLGNLIPEWNDLVRRGRWDAASDRLHATNNFPEFTGRLCPAPCETACVLSIAEEQTGGSVTIKRIEQTIADQAWMDGIVEPQPAAISTGKRVAVVGSGPAGLAAAQQLTRAGHDVTVYERDDRIGGLMRYGIPEYKLEKATLNQRLAQMRAEGTRFVTETEVGVDLPVEQLKAQYDAVVLAVGALRARDNDVEGRHLERRAPGDGAPGACEQGMRGRRAEPDLRQGQARRDHRRRRHRRRLPRHRAPAGRDVGDPTGLQPGAAGVPRRIALTVADVADRAAHPVVASARRGRRPPLRGRGAAFPRRRARPPAGHGDRRGEGRTRRRRPQAHHSGRGFAGDSL